MMDNDTRTMNFQPLLSNKFGSDHDHGDLNLSNRISYLHYLRKRIFTIHFIRHISSLSPQKNIHHPLHVFSIFPFLSPSGLLPPMPHEAPRRPLQKATMAAVSGAAREGAECSAKRWSALCEELYLTREAKCHPLL